MAEDKVQPAARCRLKLEGNWTVERAVELKRLLLEALGDDNPVLVELEGLGEVDLACLQLLCAAHRASLQLGKPLELEQEKPETLKRVVRDAGFVRTLGCHRNPTKNCLWIGDWQS